DTARFSKVHKEYKDLQPIVVAFKTLKQYESELSGAKEMLSEGDEELRVMAKAEIASLQEEIEKLEIEIKELLIPKDPEDSKDIILEIRSGTGGDEASIFAGDLLRMYTRFFDKQGWKTELIYENQGAVGGYNKVVLEVTGEDVYGKMKFESGTHRVQRVPKTEAQGRVHTSAATVVAVPKLELDDVNINKADLRVDTFRASGAGGQHVNKTESGVRFTHIPTGIVSESTESRSQHKNREIAMGRLLSKIQEAQIQQHNEGIAAQRKSIVGSGDRSEKIRTYNFPQNRLTDHRINLTLYNLDVIMDGYIDDIIEKLRVADNAEKMKGQTESV
ncbi:MAG: peptide chain release factor 1, partial [Saprospiraceae bacterium]|nr:peptide chain release factor 1 [Saprospiraceae bacterium]